MGDTQARAEWRTRSAEKCKLQVLPPVSCEAPKHSHRRSALCTCASQASALLAESQLLCLFSGAMPRQKQITLSPE